MPVDLVELPTSGHARIAVGVSCSRPSCPTQKHCRLQPPCFDLLTWWLPERAVDEHCVTGVGTAQRGERYAPGPPFLRRETGMSSDRPSEKCRRGARWNSSYMCRICRSTFLDEYQDLDVFLQVSQACAAHLTSTLHKCSLELGNLVNGRYIFVEQRRGS